MALKKSKQDETVSESQRKTIDERVEWLEKVVGFLMRGLKGTFGRGTFAQYEKDAGIDMDRDGKFGLGEKDGRIAIGLITAALVVSGIVCAIPVFAQQTWRWRINEGPPNYATAAGVDTNGDFYISGALIAKQDTTIMSNLTVNGDLLVENKSTFNGTNLFSGPVKATDMFWNSGRFLHSGGGPFNVQNATVVAQNGLDITAIGLILQSDEVLWNNTDAEVEMRYNNDTAAGTTNVLKWISRSTAYDTASALAPQDGDRYEYRFSSGHDDTNTTRVLSPVAGFDVVLVDGTSASFDGRLVVMAAVASTNSLTEIARFDASGFTVAADIASAFNGDITFGSDSNDTMTRRAGAVTVGTNGLANNEIYISNGVLRVWNAQ